MAFLRQEILFVEILVAFFQLVVLRLEGNVLEIEENEGAAQTIACFLPVVILRQIGLCPLRFQALAYLVKQRIVAASVHGEDDIFVRQSSPPGGKIKAEDGAMFPVFLTNDLGFFQHRLRVQCHQMICMHRHNLHLRRHRKFPVFHLSLRKFVLSLGKSCLEICLSEAACENSAGDWRRRVSWPCIQRPAGVPLPLTAALYQCYDK